VHERLADLPRGVIEPVPLGTLRMAIRSGEATSRGTASKLANTAIATITWPIVKRNDFISGLRIFGLFIAS
jgi:hypothetical protein